MKKTILGLLLLTTLVGCAPQTVSEATDESVRFAGLEGKVTIVTDNETGCKYVRERVGVGSSQSITLATLLKSDGAPDCD